jgi:hypothetical protein
MKSYPISLLFSLLLILYACSTEKRENEKRAEVAKSSVKKAAIAIPDKYAAKLQKIY